MREILIILLLPFFILAQDSWVEIQFEFDGYAEEVSWRLYNNVDTFYVSEGYYENLQPNAYQFIELNSGNYTFELLDSYGDGLSWPIDGWCLVSNECQDTLFYAEGDYGLGLIESLTIAPCAPPEPPVIGCMDESALNYNPDADINDQYLCEYPICEGWGEPFVDQICEGGQALLYYNWETSDNPNCNVIQITYGSNSFTNSYTFDVNIDIGIWGVYVGNGQMPPNWEEEYSLQVMYADSTVSDTLFYTPYPCTQGCTDDDAPNYNPWATVDDGSCGGQACDVGYTPMIIEITLDNWPGETGWSFVSGDGSTQVQDGTYTYQDVGQTYTYGVCAMESGFEFIITDTYGDGLAGSTTGGTVDGNVIIRGCNGEIITQLSDGNWVNGNQELTGVGFGSVAYSTWQQSTVCETEDVLGCTDPAYQEFNPEASVDDGSCGIEHLYGCMDVGAFNYNENATAMEIYPNCNYELWIGDAGADGWGNSSLGIVQGDNMWSFTMGPGSYEQTFPIWLETDKPVKIYYFEVGGIQTPVEEVEFQTLHNSFKLTNSNGDVLLYEGWNPFADNGQGALQPFEPPFFQTYQALPFCGTLCIPTIEGCTDEEAFNYNEDANTDDGGCIPVVEGCTNDLAFNYDSLANVDDGSCISVVVGCMDIEAFNYNPNANVDDSASCIPVIYGCMDDTMFNYNQAANTSDNSCVEFIYGCTDPEALNYDPEANTDNFSCIAYIYGCIDPDAFNYNPLANTDDGTCIPEVVGCTDSTAINYDSEANINFGCEYPVYGCMDPNAFNYDINANVDDDSCEAVVIGCTDDTALNYDITANTNSGCIYAIYGCTNPESFNYDLNANVDDGSCVPVIIGCTDSTALNYNPNANTNNGCIYPILGCTNPDAFNYSIDANTDDGSCVEVVLGCMDATMFNYDELANTDSGNCVPYVYGCMDSGMFNYNPLANADNNTCIPFVYGCTDLEALNFNLLANTLDNSCCYVGGCTDITALNYDVNACYDDGSCVVIIEGCADPNAYNYDPLVNLPDNTVCLYDAGCIGGPGEPYWLNDLCYAWVVEVDDYCCDVEWDSVCESMYNYCGDGWPVDARRFLEGDIIVYPNPTKDILNIETRLDITVEVYDLLGSIIKINDFKKINLSNYPNGIYNLVIKYDKIVLNKKIIKL